LYPIKGHIDELAYNNGEGGIEEDDSRKFISLDREGNVVYDGAGKKKAIVSSIHALDLLNKPIILVYPIPEVGWDIPRLNFKRYMRGIDVVSSNVSTSYERFKIRNEFVNNLLDNLDTKNIFRVRPENLFCNTFIRDRCVAQINGVPLYFDSNHLSNEGARLIVDEVMKLIKNYD
jgi:hypothetical protein